MPDQRYPETKWFKLTTTMFDDEKIRFIESLPDSDTILIIFIKLISMAMRINDGGWVYLTKKVPFTEETLAHVLNRKIQTVRLALKTFEKLEMVEINPDGIYVLKFGKHQNIEGLEKMREVSRASSNRYRQKVRLTNGEVTSPVTPGDALEGGGEEGGMKNEEGGMKNEEIFKIWNNVLDKIKLMVKHSNYETWFKDTVCIEIADTEITIGVPSESKASHLEKQSMSLIGKAVTEVTGQNLKLKLVLLEKGD